MEEEEKDVDSDENTQEEMNEVTSSVKPTSLQQKMVALSGQNVDEFMKEMEVVQKKIDADKEDDSRVKPSGFIEPPAPPGIELVPVVTTTLPPKIVPQNPPPIIFPTPTPLRVPPGPPPGRPLLPPGPPPGLPPRLGPIRMQPAPHRMLRMPAPPAGISLQPNLLATPNVLSAAPQLITRSDVPKQGATISAKPQIRNLSADVTRFVPSTLRVKREDKRQKPSRAALVNEMKQKEMMALHIPSGQPTKDDAYMQFMKEMQGLL